VTRWPDNVCLLRGNLPEEMLTRNKLHQEHYKSQFFFRKYLIIFLIPVLTGCAAIVVTGAGIGVSYTLTNVAYRSFSSPMDQVHESTIADFKEMDIKIIDDVKLVNGRTITADTMELDIVIDLEKVTLKTTQIKVDARKNVLLKDKATAAEIINQVGKNLEE
jgi:hypothetical protein